MSKLVGEILLLLAGVAALVSVVSSLPDDEWNSVNKVSIPMTAVFGLLGLIIL